MLLTLVIILACAGAALPQKRSTVLGDSFTGVIVAADKETREITLEYKGEGKAESFTGTLDPTAKIKLRDGAFHRPYSGPFEVAPGERVRVFYKSRQQEVGGRKVKFNAISRLDFIGEDAYTILRTRLGLPKSYPVEAVEEKALPPANPLRLHVRIESHHLKNSFNSWLSAWEKKEAAKYGSVKVVADLSQADAVLLCYDGSEVLLDPFLLPRRGEPYTVTAFLLKPNGPRLEIIWRQMFVTHRDEPADGKGLMEKEVGKRLKARPRK
jgi:hypothetical protein